jgi:DNA-binding MarR family transcriptional regulator
VDIPYFNDRWYDAAVVTGEITREERWLRTAPRLHGLVRAVGREFEERLRVLGLTTPQAGVLKRLEPGGEGLAIVALAQDLDCHSSNLTGLLDRLESRGLVCREPHPADRRVKVVRLTSEGVATREAVLELLAPVPRALDTLDEDDMERLEALLAKAAAAEPAEGPHRD